MARKEIKEMNKRWREALATPTKPLHDPVPLGEIIDEYLEGKELFDDCISRKAVLDEMKIRRANGDMITAGFIKGLPPVTPKPKTDMWSIKDVADTFKKHGLIREQEPCEDCISRKAVLDALNKWDWQELYLPVHFKDMIDDLPSIQPKPAHWIEEKPGVYKCSNCGRYTLEWGGQLKMSRYCPNCGARMESEDKE